MTSFERLKFEISQDPMLRKLIEEHANRSKRLSVTGTPLLRQLRKPSGLRNIKIYNLILIP
ncbi:uncharacterized protein PAC_20168 [Phialocephala subalpina]|uniref:Uncharacterized protein n=1 Tax=Phialocephala subalpina TaxID=576137 RepID=A0A1L7XZ19_9HELO|nr:uncharacterized protein PAC_20168 [Phialocephala subalpina]